MVRASFINGINDIITKSGFFDIADFDVRTDAGNRADTLHVQYKYETGFFFTAAIPRTSPGSENYKITFSVAPGEINQKESGVALDAYDLNNSINNWLSRLREELVAAPIHRELAEHKRQFEEMFDSLKANVKDTAFTRDEANHLKAELEKLKEQMIAQIQTDSANKQEQAARIDSITKDVEALKASVDILNKPNWARAAASRFYKWTKDPANRALLKDGIEVTTRLLSGNVEK